jgi:hypothetical protein
LKVKCESAQAKSGKKATKQEKTKKTVFDLLESEYKVPNFCGEMLLPLLSQEAQGGQHLFVLVESSQV